MGTLPPVLSIMFLHILAMHLHKYTTQFFLNFIYNYSRISSLNVKNFRAHLLANCHLKSEQNSLLEIDPCQRCGFSG